MSILFNNSIKEGTFPDFCKIPRITPIFKDGEKDKLSNYRPIATLPFVSKVFEKLMSVKMLDYLNKFNLLNKKQFGFQSDRSTNDAIFTILDDVYEGLNDKKNMF